MTIDLNTHSYRVYNWHGALIGHFSTVYAAASHLHLANDVPGLLNHGGKIECPDGRSIAYRDVYELHEVGVRLEVARLGAISSGRWSVAPSTDDMFATLRAAGQ